MNVRPHKLSSLQRYSLTIFLQNKFCSWFFCASIFTHQHVVLGKKYSSNCLSCCSFCILSFLSGLSVYWNNISSSNSNELFCVCCSIKASMCKITPTDKNRRQWHHKGTSPPHRYFKQRIQVTRPFFIKLTFKFSTCFLFAFSSF